MEIKRHCILMDVDGVLLDLVPNVKEYVLAKYNVHITENHITAWDWTYCLGVDLTRNKEFWDYVWESKPLTPYPWAVEFIKLLRSMGFTVVAVSNRSSRAAQKAAVRDFPMFDFNCYILVDKAEDKLEYAHKVGAHYYCLISVNCKNPQNAFTKMGSFQI